MSFLKITFAVILTVTTSYWILNLSIGRNKGNERTMEIMMGKIESQNDKIKYLETQIKDLKIILQNNKAGE